MVMAKKNNAAPENAAAPEDVAAPVIALVPMAREFPQHGQGPVTAEVHPDEVGLWQAHGWVINEGDE